MCLLLSSGACSTFIPPPPLVDPMRPAGAMAPGSTSLQLAGGIAGAGRDIFDSAGGAGGALRVERQLDSNVALGIEGLGGAGGEKNPNIGLGAGRVYAHFTPLSQWLAFRGGFGGGFIQGGIPYATGDVSTEVSAIISHGGGVYLSLGVATSALLQDGRVEAVTGHPPIQHVVLYGGGSAGGVYQGEHWGFSGGVTVLEDLQGARFTAFGYFLSLRYTFSGSEPAPAR